MVVLRVRKEGNYPQNKEEGCAEAVNVDLAGGRWQGWGLEGSVQTG